jgi:quinol-cytochrome oxidoreductase complex cytochrome b subunit
MNPGFAPRPKIEMIRPVLTELALFLTPFVLYALFLWLTRGGVLDRVNWSFGRVGWLLIVAFALMIGSFIVLAQWGGAPPGSTYSPARIEDGQFVPGDTK